ncbi:Type IV secretory pathway%2C VirB9 components [Achromobacter xylosoxidans]|nr:Type IV secretory pathway%2C VirB9 components [Achromobacter xylosoxidans]CUK23223.1 Type IV secretory pathway%2C VirB9 components [Achromobacter xylosoxidans]CUR80169.1 P-type conjugative transfer protein VirB9 [Achromobacter xylosoxidans]
MQVFDDGRETWLQFAPGQAIPAIFGVDADGERVVPYVRRDPYVVLAGNWDSLWFRGGRLLARARRAPAGGLDQGAADGDASAGMSPRVQGADNPL